MKRKRYRYIGCGLCDIDNPIRYFRLLGGNQISSMSISTFIRIEIPDDMELEKYSYDNYSTVQSEIKLRDLNPKVVYYNRKRHKYMIHENLTEIWAKGEIQPCDFFKYIDKEEYKRG